ncbi:MAG: YHS domain-containing protein [Pseudomonadota bacterium]
MIRLGIFLILIYVFFRLLNKLIFKQAPSKKRMNNPFSFRGKTPPISEMVQDPVCKVYVPKKEAVTIVRAGTTYYFCGKECREKFTAGSV